MIAAPMSRFSCTLVLICLLPIASLRAQPSAPTPAQVAQLRAIESVSHRSAASVTPFTVSTTSREEVRQFYRTIYKASNGVPMGWTGNYTASTAAAAAGDTAANYKEAVRVRINFFRALVGIPAGFMIGRFEFLSRMFNPLISLLRPVSPLAWLPIGLLVFKGANPAAIWTIFICSIWPMIINTAVGVQRVPQDYMNVARVLNLSEWKIVSKILFPSVPPAFS